MALLSLQEAYSLPILMYAAPALHLSVKQTNELNVCWNMVFRRIFRYNKWESVRAVVDGCGCVRARGGHFEKHCDYVSNSLKGQRFQLCQT